jgi:hypothetical protein
MNEISEIRISGEFPEVGRFDGSTEFANREWRWEARISETGVSDLRRIDMYVAHEELPRKTITIMTGFVSRRSGRPPRASTGGARGTRPAGPATTEPPEEGDARGPPPAPPTSPRERGENEARARLHAARGAGRRGDLRRLGVMAYGGLQAVLVQQVIARENAARLPRNPVRRAAAQPGRHQLQPRPVREELGRRHPQRPAGRRAQSLSGRVHPRRLEQSAGAAARRRAAGRLPAR